MSGELPVAIRKCLERILKPVARFCIRHSLGIRDFLDAGKRAFIEAAEEQLHKQGLKATESRVTALTGIQRYQVKDFRAGEDFRLSMHIPIRVIGQWKRDKAFTTSAGRPRVLTYEGDDSEFHTLVRKVATYLHPRSVLLALEQIGAVERSSKGLKLVTGGYVPKGSELEGLSMLSTDFENFMMSVLDNIYWQEKQLPNIHANTYFDNIAVEDMDKVRSWLEKEFYKFHQRLEKYLATFDLDIAPRKGKKGGGKIVIGSFTRTHWD